MDAAIGLRVTDHVGQSVPREAVVAERIPAIIDRLPERQAARQADRAGEVPATEDLVHCLRRAGSKVAPMAVGQLVEKRFREALRNIVSADRVVELRMVAVAPHIADCPADESFRPIIQVFGPLITGEGAEAVAERPGVLGAEGVELRSCTWQGAGRPQVGEFRIREQQLTTGYLRLAQVAVRISDHSRKRIGDEVI